MADHKSSTGETGLLPFIGGDLREARQETQADQAPAGQAQLAAFPDLSSVKGLVLRRRGRAQFREKPKRAAIPIPCGPNFLGASEIPSLLGLNRYCSPKELWYRKTGRAPESQEEDNPAVTLGKALEPAIRDLGKEIIGIPFRKPNLAWVLPSLRLVAHPDGVCGKSLLEIKTTGLCGHRYGSWDEQVPEWVEAQVQAQLAVTKLERAYVVALVGGVGLKVYEVSPDPEFAYMLAEKVGYFWWCVEKDIPPDDSPIDVGLLLRNARRTEEIEVVEDEDVKRLMEDYLQINQLLSEAEKVKEEVKRKILERIGDKAGIRCGKLEAVVKKIVQSRLNTKGLEADYPDLAQKYRTSSTSYRFEVRRV